jgi:WD40 repeat protein
VSRLYNVDTVDTTANLPHEKLFFPMGAVQIKQVKEHSDVIYDARYSPDSTLLATASWDKTVKIWNANATPTTQMVNGVGLLCGAHAETYS